MSPRGLFVGGPGWSTCSIARARFRVEDQEILTVELISMPGYLAKTTVSPYTYRGLEMQGMRGIFVAFSTALWRRWSHCCYGDQGKQRNATTLVFIKRRFRAPAWPLSWLLGR